jgi:hypothetical protein
MSKPQEATDRQAKTPPPSPPAEAPAISQTAKIDGDGIPCERCTMNRRKNPGRAPPRFDAAKALALDSRPTGAHL